MEKLKEQSCIYKTTDGYCELHSDGIEYREPCIECPCDDYRTDPKAADVPPESV